MYQVMIKLGVASLQLPSKYPQLPVLLIGQIGTLIWRIGPRTVWWPSGVLWPDYCLWGIFTTQLYSCLCNTIATIFRSIATGILPNLNTSLSSLPVGSKLWDSFHQRLSIGTLYNSTEYFYTYFSGSCCVFQCIHNHSRGIFISLSQMSNMAVYTLIWSYIHRVYTMLCGHLGPI